MAWNGSMRWHVALLVAALTGLSALPSLAQTQAAGTPDDWLGKLAASAPASEPDVAELRQRAADRIKARAKTDAAPLKRALIAPELTKLPQIAVAIQFDEDAAVVRPESYRTLGRIADTLTHPTLLGSRFLIIGRTLSTGKRENNLTLSQRRADAIRDILIGTFKVSPKRLQSVGLGEEQMLDSAHPAAAVNQAIQIATVGSVIQVNSPPALPATVRAKTGTHKPGISRGSR